MLVKPCQLIALITYMARDSAERPIKPIERLWKSPSQLRFSGLVSKPTAWRLLLQRELVLAKSHHNLTPLTEPQALTAKDKGLKSPSHLTGWRAATSPARRSSDQQPQETVPTGRWWMALIATLLPRTLSIIQLRSRCTALAKVLASRLRSVWGSSTATSTMTYPHRCQWAWLIIRKHQVSA